MSKQNVIEVKVPRRAVGAVIGAQGATIKEVSTPLHVIFEEVYTVL